MFLYTIHKNTIILQRNCYYIIYIINYNIHLTIWVLYHLRSTINNHPQLYPHNNPDKLQPMGPLETRRS